MGARTFILTALLVVAISACGGAGAPPRAGMPTPVPSPPALSALGYATLTESRTPPYRVLTEYPIDSISTRHAYDEFGGGAIEFDPQGDLWSDNVDKYTIYAADGAISSNVWHRGEGALAAIDPNGNLYEVVGATQVKEYSVDRKYRFTLKKSLTLPNFPCSSAADANGALFVSMCTVESSGRLYGPVRMYRSTASELTQAANGNTAGPLTVSNGKLYAVYGSSVGVWLSAENFLGKPSLRLPIPQGQHVLSIAADYAGNVYVVSQPNAFSPTNLLPSTLSYFSSGSEIGTTLSSGSLGQVATVPH